MPAKTYAVQVKDYLGISYTVGYVIGDNQTDADSKAKGLHIQASAVEANGDAEQDAIDRLISDANHETHHRMRGEVR